MSRDDDSYGGLNGIVWSNKPSDRGALKLDELVELVEACRGPEWVQWLDAGGTLVMPPGEYEALTGQDFDAVPVCYIRARSLTPIVPDRLWRVAGNAHLEPGRAAAMKPDEGLLRSSSFVYGMIGTQGGRRPASPAERIERARQLAVASGLPIVEPRWPASED